MSGKQDREQRREVAGKQADSSEQRTRLLQISAGTAFVVIIAVLVVIVVASNNDKSGGDASNVVEAPAVEKLLTGIPQKATALGKSSAPVTLYEYGDLQCPVCKEYSEEVLPGIIESRVKKGEVKIVYRDFIIISEESIPAGEAALAAGEQGKGWTFIELFYRNQGEERSGYVTEEFLESIAKGAGIPNLAKWNEERESGKFKKTVETTTQEAETYGFEGTPSFTIKGPKSKGVELIGSAPTPEAIEEKIEEVG